MLVAYGALRGFALRFAYAHGLAVFSPRESLDLGTKGVRSTSYAENKSNRKDPYNGEPRSWQVLGRCTIINYARLLLVRYARLGHGAGLAASPLPSVVLHVRETFDAVHYTVAGVTSDAPTAKGHTVSNQKIYPPGVPISAS